VSKLCVGHEDIHQHRDAWYKSCFYPVAEAPPVDDLQLRDKIREKDRYSYLAEHCQVDLTTTTAGSDKNEVKEITHEIEVEYRHPKYLFIEMAKWDNGEAHRFRELVNVMINSVRSLARKAK
jgi:hypothetical protein